MLFRSEKMLHTRFKAESSSDSLVFANSTYQRLSAFFFPKAISTAELIWTRLKLNEIPCDTDCNTQSPHDAVSPFKKPFNVSASFMLQME